MEQECNMTIQIIVADDAPAEHLVIECSDANGNEVRLQPQPPAHHHGHGHGHGHGPGPVGGIEVLLRESSGRVGPRSPLRDSGPNRRRSPRV